MTKADLSLVRLDGISLRKTILIGTQFTKASISDLDLKKMNISSSKWDESDIDGVDYSSANATKASFYQRELVIPSSLKPTCAKLFPRSSREKSQFNEARAGVQFFSSKFYKVIFDKSELRGANFGGAKFEKVSSAKRT